MVSDRPVLLCDLSTVSLLIVKEKFTPSERKQVAGEILLQSLSYARYTVHATTSTPKL